MGKPISQQDNPRDLALGVLVQIEKSTMGCQDALSRAFAKAPTLSHADRRLATQIVYGCLRWKLLLDYVIHKASSRGSSQSNMHIRWALRIAVYQMVKLDKIPPHAAVDNGVRQVKSVAGKNISGYANAILRKISVQWKTMLPPSGNSTRALSLLYSHPEWVIERWAARWTKEHLVEVCDAFSKPAPVVVRVRNDAIIEAKQWLNGQPKLSWESGHVESCLHLTGGIDPRGAELFEEGKWISQDEGSQWVVNSVGLNRGQRVLDFCAGTGTKTTQILDLVGPEGQVVACDIKESKLRKLRDLCNRWGQSVETHCLDGRRSEEWKPEPFDVVLVDAPCTGLGTIRRRPEIKWRRSSVDIRRTQTDQMKLLKMASQYVKKGGILVYAVCSTIQEECEDVVAEFLKNSGSDFVPRSFPEEDGEGHRTLDPSKTNMDGFFIAQFTRK